MHVFDWKLFIKNLFKMEEGSEIMADAEHVGNFQRILKEIISEFSDEPDMQSVIRFSLKVSDFLKNIQEEMNLGDPLSEEVVASLAEVYSLICERLKYIIKSWRIYIVDPRKGSVCTEEMEKEFRHREFLLETLENLCDFHQNKQIDNLDWFVLDLNVPESETEMHPKEGLSGLMAFIEKVEIERKKGLDSFMDFITKKTQRMFTFMEPGELEGNYANTPAEWRDLVELMVKQLIDCTPDETMNFLESILGEHTGEDALE